MSETAQFVQNVRSSLAGTYDVLGYVGTDGSTTQVLLGREVATGALVGISVTPDAVDDTEYSVDIQQTLGKTVTVEGSMCPECRTPLPELDAFCFHCGANLSGAIAAAGTPEAEIVLNALATATAGRYEILGRLDREGSTGAVYFARELATDRIAALRLKRVDGADAAQPEYVQKLTKIFDTGKLQEKIAQRKAQQEAEAVAAAERVAAERVAAERAAAERAAAERAAAERAAAERVAADRAAAERAAAERAVAERAATASVAAYTPPPVVDFSPPQELDSTPVSQPIAQTNSNVDADHTAPKNAPSMRVPLIGVAVVALLAVIGYFAFSGGDKQPTVATAPADSSTAPVAVQPPIDSATLVVPTAADSATVTAPTAAGEAPTDSGTIRVSSIPADARVAVDGKSMRGRVLRVTARAHQLTVTAKGFEPFTEKVTVAAGATVRWAPKLVAVVAATTANNAAPPPVPANTSANSNSRKSCRDLIRAEDWSNALDACTTDANAGNAYASASLGRMYAKGLGVARDPGAAVSWYRKGAAAGDHDAQSFMGYAFRDGNGEKRDVKASTDMFKLAAEGGEKAAQLEYAVALERGDGISKNQVAAREWYKKAADQGVFMAARRLGRMFEKGDGGPKSEPEAIAAYEKAATLGDAESAMTVGKWYRDGRGVTPSPAQALTWFKKALELGNKDAQNEIRKLQK